ARAPRPVRRIPPHSCALAGFRLRLYKGQLMRLGARRRSPPLERPALRFATLMPVRVDGDGQSANEGGSLTAGLFDRSTCCSTALLVARPLYLLDFPAPARPNAREEF